MGRMDSLSREIKISTAITPTAGAAGTDDINGTIVDMKGWQGLLILVRVGALTTGAVTSIKAQQGAASNLSDAADIEGSNQDIADTDDDETFYMDIPKVAERYVRVVVSRATENAVIACANYIQYNPVHLPGTHGTGVTGETVASLKEGTA
jgi:hypothetical protein